MLMDWPRIPLEKSRFLRYIPEDVDVWIKANNVSGRGHYPAFSFRVPSCPPMELVYLRSVHLNLAVSSVPKDFRWIYLAWAKVSSSCFPFHLATAALYLVLAFTATACVHLKVAVSVLKNFRWLNVAWAKVSTGSPPP